MCHGLHYLLSVKKERKTGRKRGRKKGRKKERKKESDTKQRVLS